MRRLVLVGAVAVALLPAGCRPIESAHRSDAPRPAAVPATVTLTEEAASQAGIATETVRTGPFSVTLPLIARLSPVPETPEEMEARLAFEAAATRERRAAQELDRVRRLAADQVVASKVVQAAEADATETRLEQLRAETALRNLGLDTARAPGYPSADLWALADLYGPDVPKVKPGAPAFVSVESFPGEAFAARVVTLARSLNPRTRTLTVRIAIQDPRHRLRPQDMATAEVQVDQRQALSVAASALLYDETARILFVRKGDQFERVPVQVGSQQAGRAEILKGLAEGDVVVTSGAQFLLGELYKQKAPAGEDD